MHFLRHCENSRHNDNHVNIFTIYQILFQNVITIFPITYQNKPKMPGKIGSAWFLYKKWQVISTIYKLFEYHFW